MIFGPPKSLWSLKDGIFGLSWTVFSKNVESLRGQFLNSMVTIVESLKGKKRKPINLFDNLTDFSRQF